MWGLRAKTVVEMEMMKEALMEIVTLKVTH